MNDDLRRLIDSLAPALAVAFLAAIALLRGGIDYAALIDALKARDIDAAIDALNIDRGAFGQYVLERQAAFGRAGAVVSEAVTLDRIAFFKRGDRDVMVPRADPVPSGPSGPLTPTPPAPPTLAAPGGGNVVFRFDMTNPRAEATIRTEAASRVAGYVDEQIDAARRVIVDGFSRGEGPQSIATDIAGRINPISGRREGGIVGLSDPQVGYVENMRARLQSGDPDEMVKVLGRFDADGKWIEGTGMTLRDRRYDGKIKAAIKAVAAGNPNPLTDDVIAEMTAKYSDRLLKRRAEDISRTETAQGVMLARAEATRQALNKSGLPDNAVEKFWRHNGGGQHDRDWHLAMNDKSVVGIDVPFHMPDGSMMLHSHDPMGGARNNVSCACSTDFDVDWAFGLT